MQFVPPKPKLLVIAVVSPAFSMQSVTSGVPSTPGSGSTTLIDGAMKSSINVVEPDPGVEGTPLVTDCMENVGIQTAMTNSFGFGGTNCTLVFQKV